MGEVLLPFPIFLYIPIWILRFLVQKLLNGLTVSGPFLMYWSHCHPNNSSNMVRHSSFWSTIDQNWSYHLFKVVCTLSEIALGILSWRMALLADVTCNTVLILAAFSQPWIYSGEYNLWHIQLTSCLGGRSRKRQGAELIGYCCTSKFCAMCSHSVARPE